MTHPTLPLDYELCGDCGFDHEYEPQRAIKWHKAHPCSYCKYDSLRGTHETSCITIRHDVKLAEPMKQCEGCLRTVRSQYRYCIRCSKTKG